MFKPVDIHFSEKNLSHPTHNLYVFLYSIQNSGIFYS